MFIEFTCTFLCYRAYDVQVSLSKRGEVRASAKFRNSSSFQASIHWNQSKSKAGMKFNKLRLDENSLPPPLPPPPEMLLPLYNFLQLHLLLTFSCFSNPNLLNYFLHPLALIRTPFYSRVDCHGNYNICNIWPISYKNILRLNFPNCKDISMPQMCQPKCWN